MGVADGFIKGVSLASGVERDRNNQRLNERRMGMAEDLHSSRMSLAGVQQSAAEQNLSALQYQNSDEQRLVRENQQQLSADISQQGLANSKLSNSVTQQNLANSKLQHSNLLSAQERQKKQARLQENLQAISLKEQSGVPVTLDDFKEFEGTLLDPARYRDPQTLAKLEALESYLDPRNTDKAGNDPQMLAIMNDVFADEIKQGGGTHPVTGSPAVDKAIAGVRQIEDGRYVPSLNVQYEDGSIERDVPMTVGRDSTGNELTAISMDKLVDRVHVQKRYAQMMQPLFKSVKAYGGKDKPRDHKGKGSFDGFGQKGLDSDTFNTLYQQSYAIKDPITGNEQFSVSFDDVRQAGNNPKALSELKALDEHNRSVIASNAQRDADEQQPLMTLSQLQKLMKPTNAKNDGGLNASILSGVKNHKGGQGGSLSDVSPGTEEDELLAEAEEFNQTGMAKVGDALGDVISNAPEALLGAGPMQGGNSLSVPKSLFNKRNDLKADIKATQELIINGQRTPENFAKLKQLLAEAKG